MDGQMISLADMASLNVFAQLQIDNPPLAEEIKQVMSAEVRRIEIELSMMMTDLKRSFNDDIESLRETGKVLPEDHLLQPAQQNQLAVPLEVSNGL